MASQISGVSIVYSAVCWGAAQRKHQSSASLAIVRGIHRWSVNSPHRGPVTRKMFPLKDVIMPLLVTCRPANIAGVIILFPYHVINLCNPMLFEQPTSIVEIYGCTIFRFFSHQDNISCNTFLALPIRIGRYCRALCRLSVRPSVRPAPVTALKPKIFNGSCS